MTKLYLNDNNVYFSEEIKFNIKDYSKGIVFDWSYCDINSFLYKKKTRLSLIIDLTKDVKTIYKEFNPTTRNEINKAQKLNFKFDYNVNLEDLLKKHNKMLVSKNLPVKDRSFYFGLSQNPATTSISSIAGGGVASCSFVHN